MTAQHPPQASDLDPRVARLAAVVECQQQEIERLRAERDGRLLVPLAEGILVERLGYCPAEAAAHLADLATQTGSTVPELAADLVAGAVQTPQLPAPASDSAPDFARLPDGDAENSALLEEVRHTAGAVAVALWQVQPDGALGLAGQSGLDLLEASRWRHIPVLMDCLPQRVARERRPHWIPAVEFAPSVPMPGDGRCGARAVIPVRTSRGVAGVAEFVWDTPRPVFPPEQKRRLTALAALCGREIMLSTRPAGALPSMVGLLDSGLFARPRADESGQVVDFEIAQVGEDFEDPGGRQAAELVGRGLTRVYPLLCAYGLADRAVEVLTTGATAQLKSVPLTRHGSAATPAMVDVRITRFLDGVRIGLTVGHDDHRLARLLHNLQHIARLGSWEHSMLTGQMTWTEHTFELFGLPTSAGPLSWDELCTYVHPDDLPIMEAFQTTLLAGQEAATVFRLIRPDGTHRQIRAHGEPVNSNSGELVTVRGIYQDLSAEYQSQVALSATRDRLADTEHEAQQQNRIARELQQAILPSSARPVAMDGLDVAVRYRPAAQEHKVGGDWYDATVLPTGKILLVIGDVAGHGIGAATGMIALRNALRGLAVTGAGPGRLLDWLNTTTFTVNRGITGTALCGLYEPDSRTLTWARAGHLPPMLVRDGVAEQLPLPRGILLGARPNARFQESVLRLRPADTLILFTDGLIERRGVLLDDSLDRLATAACHAGADVERISDGLLAEATSDTEDDSCLIVIRVSEPVTSA